MDEHDDPVLEMEVSDERFTAWMRGNLDRAATHFGLTLAGEAVFGWRLRSIAAPTTGPAGPRWLRVVSEYPEWAGGDGWTGNADANALAGLPKPCLLGVTEWDDGGRRQRAEVLTLLSGQPVSVTEVTRQAVHLSPGWWRALRAGLDRLRVHPTTRVSTGQDTISRRSQAVFGTELRIERWETVHGDLHWANLLAPDLAIVDWELWGRGPAGYDAATLYCHSLLVPELADQVHETLADLLDSPDGRIAQLAAAGRMLNRIIGSGDYPDLEEPLRRHVAQLAETSAR